ncbi:MAG: AAA family ATPase [Bacteroidales bacterium]|nr:AAA family ATPase [Bacteroidales bacterium]
MRDKKLKENILKSGEILKDTYEVDCYIGSGVFGEVYRVRHKYLGLQALKLIKPGMIDQNSISNYIAEAQILSKLTHPNIVRVFETNKYNSNIGELIYIVMEYVSGESLEQLLKRKIRIGIPIALSIQRDLCAGLSFAHKQDPAAIHRDIKPQNILLSYDTSIPTGKVSDFGLAGIADPVSGTISSAGTLTYLPPEGFWNYHTSASDVFSAGIILYQMITGSLPWVYDFTEINSDPKSMETAVIKARKTHPQKPSRINELSNRYLDEIILTALEEDPVKRYKDASEFLSALLDYENRSNKPKISSVAEKAPKSTDTIAEARGFEAVAGMNELKILLYNEIILPMNQRELYDKYRIPLPNGILFYGPPGCGKTFISRKLAEEVSYNFIEIKPSDLGSIYVHGSQKKIGELFQKAREMSPTILFIDEIDALIPIRDSKLDQHYSSEVNEFLSQMNDCSSDGVVMICASNRPDKIDPAALRTGRIDKLVLVTPPDYHARMALFELFLKGRPVEGAITYNTLAADTEYYVGSDISAIVNDAARIALRANTPITMDHLEKTILDTSPSVSKQLFNGYKNFASKRSFD